MLLARPVPGGKQLAMTVEQSLEAATVMGRLLFCNLDIYLFAPGYDQFGTR